MNDSKTKGVAPAPQSFTLEELMEALECNLRNEAQDKDPVLSYPNHFNPRCFK
jgi:hypothetical protein